MPRGCITALWDGVPTGPETIFAFSVQKMLVLVPFGASFSGWMPEYFVSYKMNWETEHGVAGTEWNASAVNNSF